MSAGAVILAGGRSTRMGTDKATLDWHGTPLLAHIATTLAAAVVGPVVVVRRHDQELPPLPPGVEVATDAAPDRGPLEGLAAGLNALDGRVGAAFACATDMPLIDARVVARMLRALRDDDDAAAATDGERLLPLGAVYRTRLHALAAQRAAGEDRSLRGLLDAVRTRAVELAPAELARLRSFDRPEDFRS